jgi:hypothetical protein
MLDQSREFSQQRPRPPHRLRVPVSEAVPEAPYVLPRLKTDAVEEGLLDAVNVVVGPPLAEVGQVLAEGDRLVGGNERGPENILMFRRLARPADKLFPKQTPRWCMFSPFYDCYGRVSYLSDVGPPLRYRISWIILLRKVI